MLFQKMILLLLFTIKKTQHMSATTTDFQNSQLQIMLEAYNTAIAKNKIKSYLSIIRDATNLEWMTSRGICYKFKDQYTNYIPNVLLAPSHKENLFYVVKDETVVKRLVSKVNAFYKQIAQSKEVTTTTQTAPPAEKLSDLDARIAAAVENFLNVNGITMNVNNEIKEIESELKANAAKFRNDFVNSAARLEDSIKERTTREVLDAVNSLRPVYIKIDKRDEIKLESRAHVAFEKCLKLANREKQVFIAGPAGTGKTTLAKQVSKAFGLPFGQISCTLGMSEAHLLGRMDAHGNYISSSFVEIYENGGVFLFDEVDAADANTMLIINSALANGLLSIPNRKGNNYAHRHANFYCICAANTWGYGSSEYAGRNILDAAFLDRFAGSRMMVNYDTELEKCIAGKHTVVTDILWKVRKNISDSKIRRIVSTRAIESATRALLDKETMEDYINTFTTGWTVEEKAKALKDVVLV